MISCLPSTYRMRSFLMPFIRVFAVQNLVISFYRFPSLLYIIFIQPGLTHYRHRNYVRWCLLACFTRLVGFPVSFRKAGGKRVRERGALNPRRASLTSCNSAFQVQIYRLERRWPSSWKACERSTHNCTSNLDFTKCCWAGVSGGR